MADTPVWYVTGKNFAITEDMQAVGAAGNLYCKLLDSTYVPVYTTTTLTVADIGHEAAAGVALTNVTAAMWGSEVEAEIFCNNITFSGVSATVGFVLFYSGTVPLCLLELDTPVTYTNEGVTLLVNEGGLFAQN